MNEEEMELKNNAIIHKDNSLTRLDLSFLTHIELSEYKKSDLLAYWIKDFAEYHDQERTFNIAKSGVYSRGDVIKVNLGFNIGNELGGLHYCIVLINQITTISKQRIYKDVVRRNVKISSQSLDLIDEQIIKFFTK